MIVIKIVANMLITGREVQIGSIPVEKIKEKFVCSPLDIGNGECLWVTIEREKAG